MTRKTLLFADLGRMIKQAERQGISPTNILRLLKLYFGIDTQSLLGDWGAYMQCNFNQISNLLKMRTPTELTQLVRQSGWFIMGECPPVRRSHYPILWFASPVFLDEAELTAQLAADDAPDEPVSTLTDEVMMGGLFSPQNAPLKMSETNAEDLPATAAILHCKNAPVNCIINYTGKKYIILPGRKKQASSGALASPEKGEGKEPVRRRLPEPVRDQIVTQFIDEVRQSEAHRPMFDGILRQLTNPTRDGLPQTHAERFSHTEARDILRILMYCHVKPYFMDSERFFRTESFTNRVAWLQSLLYSGYGKRLLGQARTQYRRSCSRQQRQQLQADLQQRRSQRPLSPHEWMEDGHRYYQDSLDGVVSLPDDAPPRPSDTSHWNFVNLSWYE